MSLTAFPDWRKVGKGIGKKLRDILNPPDGGPSPEERLAQRLQDSLKGLVYFDRCSEVKAWTENDIDPIHRANVPLLQEVDALTADQSGSTARILLCHDYNGVPVLILWQI